MQLITNRSHLDDLPESSLKQHIQKRFDQLFETEDDLPPIFVIIEEDDDITGPDFAFVGNRGLPSDLWEEHEPHHRDFARPYESVSYLPGLQIYEVLLLINNEDGYWILIPESIVEAYPDLKFVLTSPVKGGLTDPQPL